MPLKSFSEVWFSYRPTDNAGELPTKNVNNPMNSKIDATNLRAGEAVK